MNILMVNFSVILAYNYYFYSNQLNTIPQIFIKTLSFYSFPCFYSLFSVFSSWLLNTIFESHKGTEVGWLPNESFYKFFLDAWRSRIRMIIHQIFYDYIIQLKSAMDIPTTAAVVQNISHVVSTKVIVILTAIVKVTQSVAVIIVEQLVVHIFHQVLTVVVSMIDSVMCCG